MTKAVELNKGSKNSRIMDLMVNPIQERFTRNAAGSPVGTTGPAFATATLLMPAVEITRLN